MISLCYRYPAPYRVRVAEVLWFACTVFTGNFVVAVHLFRTYVAADTFRHVELVPYTLLMTGVWAVFAFLATHHDRRWTPKQYDEHLHATHEAAFRLMLWGLGPFIVLTFLTTIR